MIAMIGEDYTPRVYRLYHMDGCGGIEFVSVIEATTAAEAVNFARAQLATHAGEIWLDDELIGHVIT